MAIESTMLESSNFEEMEVKVKGQFESMDRKVGMIKGKKTFAKTNHKNKLNQESISDGNLFYLTAGPSFIVIDKPLIKLLCTYL